MTARLQAHRWPGTMAAALVILVIGVLDGSVKIHLPFGDLPISGYLLVNLGTVLIMTIPLMSAMPELEHSLPREGRMRVVRCAGTVLMAAAVVLGVGSPTWEDIALGMDSIKLDLLLAAVAVIAVVGVGDIAWLVPSTVGYLALIVDSSITQPISTRLAPVSVWVLFLPLIAACAVYVWRGPRRPT